MKILEAEVVSFIDNEKEGTILAIRRNEDSLEEQEEFYEVFYTSPWGTVGKDSPGMYAVPGPGQKILILQPDQSNIWYFLSVIHSGPFKGETSVPKDLYKKRDVPQQFIIRDPVGNELLLSHSYKGNFNYKAELKSRTGKKLSLNDSPKVNQVSLTNEEGDGLKIRGRFSGPAVTFPPAPAARSIELKAKGPVNVISRESNLNVGVIDGKDLNIHNASTGLNGLYTSILSDQSSILGSKLPFLIFPYGNINVTSDWRDVNITAGMTHKSLNKVIPAVYEIPEIKEHYRGKVMISAHGGVTNFLSQGSVVQLKSDGSVIIKAPKGKVYIQGDTVNIRGDTEVNIESPGNVNIRSGLVTTITGGSSALDPVESLFGVRPLPSELDATIQAYEQGLYEATNSESFIPGPPATPTVSNLVLGPQIASLSSGFVSIEEFRPRTPLEFGSVSIIGMPTSKKASTPPHILNDNEKQITPT